MNYYIEYQYADGKKCIGEEHFRTIHAAGERIKKDLKEKNYLHGCRVFSEIDGVTPLYIRSKGGKNAARRS